MQEKNTKPAEAAQAEASECSALLAGDEVMEIIFWHFRRNFRNQKEAGEHYGCSNAFISAVQSGKKPPTKKMMADMGINRARVTAYVRAS